jgi:hypothetical protein
MADNTPQQQADALQEPALACSYQRRPKQFKEKIRPFRKPEYLDMSALIRLEDGVDRNACAVIGVASFISDPEQGLAVRPNIGTKFIRYFWQRTVDIPTFK